MNKTQTESKDCFGCRFVTGTGVIGIGAYIYAQSKKRGIVEMNAMRILSAGVICLGIARLLNMDFLKADKRAS